jgi:hypothetical protein
LFKAPDLTKIAQHVGKPGRQNCGSCHLLRSALFPTHRPKPFEVEELCLSRTTGGVTLT